MAEYEIQFKGSLMRTWFTVDELQLTEQIKSMLVSTYGSRVKVKLDKNGLRITKTTAIPLMGSEKKIPLSQIKNMFTDPKFPLSFFCTTREPVGNLMKTILIRCSKAMYATGIVNYYRKLTNKKRVYSHPITETRKINNVTSEKVTANVQAAVASAAKDENKDQTATDEKGVNNGDLSTNANDNDVEKITPPPKKAETSEALNTQNEAVPAKENGIQMQEKNIKMVSKEVESIPQQTLKKHPATISRQEYIDANEKGHRFATELSKQDVQTTDSSFKNPRPSGQIYAQVDRSQLNKRRHTIKTYPTRHDRFFWLGNKGEIVPVQTVNVDSRGNIANIQRRARPNSVQRSGKENEEIKVTTLPTKSKTIAVPTVDSTAEVNGPISGKGDVTATEPQEPIYASVVKNRANKDGNVYTNGDAKLHANNYDNNTATHVQIVNDPPIPPRAVTFQNRSSEMLKRPSKKSYKAAVRPHSFYHQLQPASSGMMSLNTHVPKPIEKVYNNSASLTRSWKLSEHFRPRVNSNTFNDTKRVALYQEKF